MKKLILLSLILLPFMSSVLDAGAPPTPPKMPDPTAPKKKIPSQTPTPSGQTSSGAPSSAKPKAAPKSPGFGNMPSAVGDGFDGLKTFIQKRLPFDTEITVDQGLILKVFDEDKLSLNEDQKKVLQERLKHVHKVLVPGKNVVEWQHDEKKFGMELRQALARDIIEGSEPLISYSSVILTKDGKPVEAAPAGSPKQSGPKPSVPLSSEQKLVQNLASLEVGLTTLSNKI